MKPNEYALTIVQLSAPIFCFCVGMIVQGIFLTLWLVFFGCGEWISHYYTGKTLSQNVWKQPTWKRVILSILMILGMVALGYHFIWG